MLPTICSSGAAELVGALLYLFGPALAALAGSALTAALSSASVAILVGTLAHAIGLSLALGGHRLRRRGHWLGRPLLFSAAVVVFTLAGFASIGVALGIVTGDSAGWWLTIAPLSALLAQLASVFLGAVWLLGHTGSLLGDWLEQIWTERSETFETRWRRVRTGARWLGVALWLLAALALLAASAFGVVTALALMLVAHAARGLLAVHAGLMAVGVVAAFVVVMRQLPRLRNPDPERWVPTLRLRPRDSAPGHALRVLVSWLCWLTAEALVVLSGGLTVLGPWLAATALMTDGDGAFAAVGAVFALLGVGGLYLGRLGGWLRPIEPGAHATRASAQQANEPAAA